MLVRFIVKNLFSFQDFTEFNMLPGRYNRLPHHVYERGGLELLKLNVMYGANGAGKSNMIRGIVMLRDFVIQGSMPYAIQNQVFRSAQAVGNNEVYLGVEFVKNNTVYFYNVTLSAGIVLEEELSISGLGVKEDVVLFKRTDNFDKQKPTVDFYKPISEDRETAFFPDFIVNEMLHRNQPILFFMGDRKNEVFKPFKEAFEWFTDDLLPILPSSKRESLLLLLEKDQAFLEFVNNTLRTFDTGIEAIWVVEGPMEQYFQGNQAYMNNILAELKANPDLKKSYALPGEDIIFELVNGEAKSKRLLFLHKGNTRTAFAPFEESDGTRKLIDYLPALYDAVFKERIYIIDEIERSIHPLLIKELIKKFSLDVKTKGQLIFTTHESNLLDQEFLRPDEIWFAEKNQSGATELRVLSEYKEHHTIDIKKGYLNGRYGAIPFLGNLKDLKWDNHAEAR